MGRRTGHRHARRLRLASGAGFLLAALTLSLAGTAARASSTDAAAEPTILALDLEGVVDPFLADHITQAIAETPSDEAPASSVLIRIDTPGGSVASMREITQAIANASVPVICYVTPQGARAASAGAFVLMSCPVAAMTPGTNVGAATPVGLDGATGSQKAVNDLAASMRSFAERYGRDAVVAESFVTDAVSLSAEEALAAGVIDLIADDESTLLDEIDGTEVQLADGTTVTLTTAGAAVEDDQMGGLTGLLHDLLDPTLAFIFFWLGIALIVLELLVPGHVFSGTIGTILLILAIVSFGFLPVRIIGVVLLIVAAILVAIEAFSPGFGIWGAAGVGCLVLGAWFLYDRSGGVQVSPVAIVPVAAMVAAFSFLVANKMLKLRSMPPASEPGDVVGREGIVIGAGLDPEGIVRVASEEWKAIGPAGTRIAAGAPVRVTKIEGLVLTVEADSDTDRGGRIPAQGERNPA